MERLIVRFVRVHSAWRVCTVAALAMIAPTLDAQSTELASRNLAGAAGNDTSWNPTVSRDGRWVAFRSSATDLVVNDTNGFYDVFVLDRQSGSLVRASVSSAGVQTNGTNWSPFISGDGRYVAFASDASNLVAGDTNGVTDIFVRDLTTSSTERVSVSSSGAEADGASDGARVAITPDGRFVAFVSRASNLVGGDNNGTFDVFVRDRVGGTTERVSSTFSGGDSDSSCWDPAISDDGRYVVFDSPATNIVAGDTNNFWDVFRRDRTSGTVELVSVGPGHVQGNGASWVGSLSADGRYLAFQTLATDFGFPDTNLSSDVYVRDLVLASLEPVTIATGGTQMLVGYGGQLSADARFVAFESGTPDYDVNDHDGFADILVRDRLNSTTTIVSRNNCGEVGYGNSEYPGLSADGSVIVFQSYASLVPADHNSADDVYVVDLAGTPPPIAAPSTYCTAKLNSIGCTPAIAFSGTPSASNPTPFVISASQVINNKFGVLFYGMDPKVSPFSGGTLCVHAPITRTAVQSSGGHAPPDDCSGTFVYDFNVRIQSGIDPRLLPCREVFAQYWSRDPKDPTGFTTGLTNAVRFQINP